MIRVLVKHSSHVFSELPEDVHPIKPNDRKEQFLDKLPEKFIHQEFIGLAKSLLIADRTADKYISIFCDKGLVVREHANIYTKKWTVSGTSIFKNYSH